MTPDDPDAVALLLPFYVNGSLGAAESAAVTAALAQSSELRAELAAISRLAHTIKTGGKAMTMQDETEDKRLQAVLGRIDDAPTPAAAPAPQSLSGLLGFLNPRRWHPAVSLSLVMAVGGQAAVIGNLAVTVGSSGAQIASLTQQVGSLQYALASGPEAVHKGSLVVQLRPDAGWAAVEALFGKEGLIIVGGPSDGSLTLSSDAKGAALDALVARLRASPLVAEADKAA
jgi:anti-sigma factor RsiW